MPAGSERSTPALPRTWRPLGPRIAGAVLGPGLAVVLFVAWVGLGEQTKAAITLWQRLTLLLFVLLGFGCLYALVRSRVEARADGLVVVNGYRTRRLAWPQVVAVHLPPGAPWATLDLADGSAVAAMGIQGSDGERARAAVRELRHLLAHPPVAS